VRAGLSALARLAAAGVLMVGAVDVGTLPPANAAGATSGRAGEGGRRGARGPVVAVETSDIPRFWRAYDMAAGKSPEDAARIYQKEYLDRGSPGLKDYASLRIHGADAMARDIAAHAQYYAAIRNTTLSLDTSTALHDALDSIAHRFGEVYDGARIPTVWLVIGRLSSGGSISGHGVLIGVEMYARDSTTTTSELSVWQLSATGFASDLPLVIAHEMVHAQQAPAKTLRSTLLEQALIEGGADFVGEKISGGHTNRAQYAYGRAHERDLWRAFQRDMTGTDWSGWLYNAKDATPVRPADLGYFIGYRICEAYYGRAHDERPALRDIVLIPDAPRMLRESAYDGAGP